MSPALGSTALQTNGALDAGPVARLQLWALLEDADVWLPRAVRAEMVERGLSYRRAAEEIGISKGHLQDVVYGRNSPTLRVVALIAAWGVSRP